MRAHAMVDGEPVEIMRVDSQTAISATERAQVDVQISTAKAYPRDVKACVAEARALALADEETAESMFYAVPRDGKDIEGPSVRLAEIIAYAWGNLRAETDIESIDDTTLTAVGTCFDLQKNVAIRARVKRRISGKNKRRYSEDMIVTTGNAASSIALRNAVFKVVPGAYWKPIYQDARRLAMGSAESVGKRWGQALEFFGKLAVTEDRVLAALGREDSHEIVPEDFLRLTGWRNALRDGEATVESIFPRPGATPAADLNEQMNAERNNAP